jgi:hypothetical protein
MRRTRLWPRDGSSCAFFLSHELESRLILNINRIEGALTIGIAIMGYFIVLNFPDTILASGKKGLLHTGRTRSCPRPCRARPQRQSFRQAYLGEILETCTVLATLGVWFHVPVSLSDLCLCVFRSDDFEDYGLYDCCCVFAGE